MTKEPQQPEMLDKYELLFFNFIQNKEAHIEKIPEAEHPTADFVIQTTDLQFIAEVTHLEQTEPISFNEARSITVGRRLKNIIHRKKKQLSKSMDMHNCPHLLVIYDLTYPPETDLHHVRSLLGDLTVSINVKTNQTTEMYHGQNAKLRPDININLSAFIIARWINSNDIDMVAYHNPYANVPFPTGFFKEHFHLEDIKFILEEV